VLAPGWALTIVKNIVLPVFRSLFALTQRFVSNDLPLGGLPVFDFFSSTPSAVSWGRIALTVFVINRLAGNAQTTP
jgi:hypothetical protein